MYIYGVSQKRPGVSGYKKMVRRYAGRGHDRFWELDFVRGLCVLLMMLDHFMYCLWDIMPDLNEMLGTSLFSGWQEVARRYWNWDVRWNVRIAVILAFFLISGISCTLTRGNFRRFIPLALVALGISAVTNVVDTFIPGTHIRFGVIHMIACGVLAYALIDNAVSAVADFLGDGLRARRAVRILCYLPAAVGAALIIFLFAAWADLGFIDGKITLTSFYPMVHGDNDLNNFHSVFIYVRDYEEIYESISADYFPLLPYAAVILLGGAIGRAIYHTPAKYTFAPLDGAWNRGFCFLGRHSGFIFVAHMIVIPVLLGVFALVTKLFI